MKNDELKAYRQKMSAEDLQMYLHFKKRGGKVAAKKGKGSYDRKNFKKEVAQDDDLASKNGAGDGCNV